MPGADVTIPRNKMVKIAKIIAEVFIVRAERTISETLIQRIKSENKVRINNV